MKKIVLVLIWVLLPLILRSQNIKKENVNNTYVTLHTTTLFHVDTPGLRLGYIQKLSKRLSLGIDYGYGSGNLAFGIGNMYINPEYQFWEIRLQLYYFFFGKGTGLSYVSGEIFYTNYRDTLEGETFKDDNVFLIMKKLILKKKDWEVI